MAYTTKTFTKDGPIVIIQSCPDYYLEPSPYLKAPVSTYTINHNVLIWIEKNLMKVMKNYPEMLFNFFNSMKVSLSFKPKFRAS